jgi:hypothetical protein
MEDNTNSILAAPKRIPWNKGKLTGSKPPLRQKHVWAIRTKLQIEQRPRDLAIFNLAIDSKLRGCDLVAVKVEDVAPNGYSVDWATVRQKKTGRPVLLTFCAGAGYCAKPERGEVATRQNPERGGRFEKMKPPIFSARRRHHKSTLNICILREKIVLPGHVSF